MPSPYEHLAPHLREYLEEPDYTQDECRAFEAALGAPGRTENPNPQELAYLHWKIEQTKRDPNFRAIKRTPEASGVQPKPAAHPTAPICPCCGEKLVCVTPGCDESGVPLKQRRLVQAELAEMKRLRLQGYSINQLTKRFKVTRPTIQRRLDEMGLRYMEVKHEE